MLTFNFYEHKQRNGSSFFTAHLVTTTECRFLWRKWTEVEEKGILMGGKVCANDWYASKFNTLEEARQACAIYSDSRKNEDSAAVVKKELVATDTLSGG